MLCLAQGCAQGRQLGACLFQTHTRLVDIELGHQTGLSQQRNGHIAQRLVGGLQRCLGRFHGMTLTAKEIDLPARIERVAIGGVAIRITAKTVL